MNTGMPAISITLIAWAIKVYFVMVCLDVGIAHIYKEGGGNRREIRDRQRRQLTRMEKCNIKAKNSQSPALMPLATIALCLYECVVLYLTLLFCLNGEQIVPIYTRSPH